MILLYRQYQNPETRRRNIIRSPNYVFRDRKCLGMPCFRPEERQVPVESKQIYGINLHREPRVTWVCAHRKDFGCPIGSCDGYTKELEKERIADGWRSETL